MRIEELHCYIKDKILKDTKIGMYLHLLIISYLIYIISKSQEKINIMNKNILHN